MIEHYKHTQVGYLIIKDKILDMCCGTGGATFTIAKKVGGESEIIGMDLSSGQINIAKKTNRFPNVLFMEGDVVNTGFEKGYFGKVFIAYGLHEMPRDIRLNVLNEAKRILKENGEVIVLELNNPKNFFTRLFIGFWFFYWLPFNFETPTRWTRVIYTPARKDTELLRKYHLPKEEQLRIARVDFQKDGENPRIIIVTDMLLTGFDAPIEQVMYLDKPLRDHKLLQAISRTNRPYPEKLGGIIVDYMGIFDNLMRALNFEEVDIEGVALNFEELNQDYSLAGRIKSRLPRKP